MEYIRYFKAGFQSQMYMHTRVYSTYIYIYIRMYIYNICSFNINLHKRGKYIHITIHNQYLSTSQIEATFCLTTPANNYRIHPNTVNFCSLTKICLYLHQVLLDRGVDLSITPSTTDVRVACPLGDSNIKDVSLTHQWCQLFVHHSSACKSVPYYQMSGTDFLG